MVELKFDRLTEKQLAVWRMRYRYGWKLKKIAVEIGISERGVWKMIGRIHKRLGLPKYRVSVIRCKPRPIWVYSLSDVFEY